MTRALLASICEQVGERASEQQLDALLAFLALLQRWNGVYNLTAARDPAQMLSHHIADCLTAAARLPGQSVRLLDVGSGGGLPGAVIAIMRPGIDVTCVDAVGKKAAFVRQVAGALQLSNLRSIHRRIETDEPGHYTLITSRAFASLAEFVHLTRSQIAVTGSWMAMKGRPPLHEIAELPADIEVFHVEQLVVPTLVAERCLVWMRPKAGYAPAE